MKIKDKRISYYKSKNNRPTTENTTPDGSISIENFIDQIIDKKYYKIFRNLRKLKIDNLDLYKSKKMKLPNVTMSGEFTKRNDTDLIRNSYTWLCPIDIDDGDNIGVDMDMVKNMLTSDDSVLFCGKSPSGKGLKALIRLKENAYNIGDHYEIMKEIIYPQLEKSLGCVFDLAQAKLSQPFFLTNDKNSYVNYDATELNVDYTLLEKVQQVSPDDATTLKKDYLIESKCVIISKLEDNFWTQIGSIVYTLGGWYKAGHFTLLEDEIKLKLKNAVDSNKNIKNKKHKYIQIEKTFKNGVDKPIYIKNRYETFVGGADIKSRSKTLSLLNTFDALKYTTSIFNPKKIYKEEKYLIYPLFKQYKLSAIFGNTGEGKSIFAMQMANIIALGEVSNNCEDYFVTKVEAQPVVYLDFELGPSSISSRYVRGGNYRFCDNLKIVNVNNLDFNDNIGVYKKQSEKNDKVIDFIFSNMKQHKSKIIFVDNLSNIADQVEQAADADGFISYLYARAKAEECTIIFVAHTPKVRKDQPITLNHFKGSSSLTKTFESVVAFKRSVTNDISYIKQVKSRDVDLIFEDDNVGLFQFIDDDVEGWLLNYIGTDDETNQLPENKKMKVKDDVEFMLQVLVDKKVNNISQRKIAEKYGTNQAAIFRWEKRINADTELKKELNIRVKYEKEMKELDEK